MIVLSHRGYWLHKDEKNTVGAFNRSFGLGFGTETDVRDHKGRLVISHDVPQGGELEWCDFLRLLKGRNLPLAVNVKADGLAILLKEAMAEQGVDWFVFDMSIPDMRSHLDAGNPVFARMSEVEQNPAWFDKVNGIWLDAFDEIWYDISTIIELLDTGKRVCVVSPELHGRAHEILWESLRSVSAHPGLMLCTDLPEQASAFFGVSS